MADTAVKQLLDTINSLKFKVEVLERKVEELSYTNITRTPTSDIIRAPTITAIGGSYGDLGGAPTINIGETNIGATPQTPYGAPIIDRYQSRIDEIEAQLADMQGLRFDVRNGNLYINHGTNDGEGEGE